MRELTLRERWLNGEDVIYDPILDVVLDDLPKVFAEMDIEERALFCQLDDKARFGVIWKIIISMRDRMRKELLYGTSG